MSEPTRTQQVLGLHQVPKDKWRRMVARTAIGLVFIGLGCAGGYLKDWDWKVVVALVVVGASTWSTQVVTSTLMALVQPLKTIRAVWRGESSDA